MRKKYKLIIKVYDVVNIKPVLTHIRNNIHILDSSKDVEYCKNNHYISMYEFIFKCNKKEITELTCLFNKISSHTTYGKYITYSITKKGYIMGLQY